METLSSLEERLRGHAVARHGADAVWIEFLGLLDALPIDARVAYLLSDVFDTALPDVAASMGRRPERCRALIDAARTRIRGASGRVKRCP